MDIARYRLLITLAECGQVTKAARVLGVAPSQVSRGLAAAEAELGSLFYRNGRGLAPTPAMVGALSQIEGVIRHHEAIVETLAQARKEIVGEVRIGMVPSLVKHLVVALVKAVSGAHPGIRMRFSEGASEELDRWRQSGEIDFAVLFRHTDTPAGDDEHLGMIDNHLVGRVGDPLLRGETVSFADLCRVPLILSGHPNGTRLQAEMIARRRNLPLRVVLEARTICVQAELTAAGCGYSVMPANAPEARGWDPRLHGVRIDDAEFRRHLAISTTKERALGVAARIALQATRARLRAGLPGHS